MIPCNTRVISECFRDQLGIIKHYRNGLFTLLYFTFKAVSKSKDVTVSVFCFDRPIPQLEKYGAFTLEDIK